MNPVNPYESSQVDLSLNAPVQTDRDFIASILGPDWLKVCEGARDCIKATKIGVFAAVVAIAIWVCIDLSMNFLANSFLAVFLAISFYAIVMQAIGIQKLRCVSIETQAKGYLTATMFLQILQWNTLLIGFVVIRLMPTSAASQNSQAMNPLLLYALCSSVFITYHVSFLLGLRQIGLTLNNSIISRDARNTALLAFLTPCYIVANSLYRLEMDLIGFYILIAMVMIIFTVGQSSILARISNYRKQFDYREKDQQLKQFFDNVSDINNSFE